MKELTWNEVKKDLQFSEEEILEMELEKELIRATIEARKKANLTQRELSKISGIKQPSIAKIESGKRLPQVNTLLKLLFSMGYTLKVVPIEQSKKE